MASVAEPRFQAAPEEQDVIAQISLVDFAPVGARVFSLALLVSTKLLQGLIYKHAAPPKQEQRENFTTREHSTARASRRIL